MYGMEGTIVRQDVVQEEMLRKHLTLTNTQINYKQWVLVALELPSIFRDKLSQPLQSLFQFIDISKSLENEFYKILTGEYLNSTELFSNTLAQYCVSEVFDEFTYYFDLVSQEIITRLEKEMTGYSIVSVELIGTYAFLIQGAGFNYEIR